MCVVSRSQLVSVVSRCCRLPIVLVVQVRAATGTPAMVVQTPSVSPWIDLELSLLELASTVVEEPMSVTSNYLMM